MKKRISIPIAFAVGIGASLYLIFGGALGRLTVPGPSHRLRGSVGVAYLRQDPSERFAVDLERLLPYMRDADWTSDHWTLWKIPVVVELRSGQKLTIDRLTGQYVIDGVPGLFANFNMPEQELGKFGSALNEVLQASPTRR